MYGLTCAWTLDLPHTNVQIYLEFSSVLPKLKVAWVILLSFLVIQEVPRIISRRNTLDKAYIGGTDFPGINEWTCYCREGQGEDL